MTVTTQEAIETLSEFAILNALLSGDIDSVLERGKQNVEETTDYEI